MFAAPYLLGITRMEAALKGAVLAAVSPAVVGPRIDLTYQHLLVKETET